VRTLAPHCFVAGADVCVVFMHVQNDAEAALFEEQVPTMVTLIKGCKSIQVVRNAADVHAGCGSAALTPSIAVHILVRVRFRLSLRFRVVSLLRSLLHSLRFPFTC
jgi:hypothetical protein